MDTTRRDHLSVYGYPRPTSPRLDELAAESAVFLNGEAQWTVTNPSHLSMVTGLYPHTHGVGANATGIVAGIPTLPEILRDAGFRTGGFVSGYPLRKPMTALDRGFRVYDAKFTGQRRSCQDTAQAALSWLNRKRQREGRVFLFVHFYDAHGPFHTSDELLEMFRSEEPGPRLDYIPKYQMITDSDGAFVQHLNDFVDRYDAQIRFQDQCLGQILDALDLDNTAVAVVADHGETLGDRERRYNLNHGTGVFGEQTGIPFVIYSPGRQPARFPLPVETVDLLPTFLELLGLERPQDLKVQGKSLVPRIEGREEDPNRKRLAFSTATVRMRPPKRKYKMERNAPVHMVRSTRWKLIVYEGTKFNYFELFDLQKDPREQVNVAEQFPDQRDALVEAFNGWRQKTPRTEPDVEMTPEIMENLRALGYLDN